MARTPKQAKNLTDIHSPSTLLAVAWSARKAGDRDLESIAKIELDRRYGIRVAIRRNGPQRPTGSQTDA